MRMVKHYKLACNRCPCVRTQAMFENTYLTFLFQKRDDF